MGRKTQFLNLHLADANDVYDVEVDQNQNFEKIDKKLKELDTGKETAFSKKTGFNLDKTDEYNLDDTNKLGTARALKRLFDEIVRRIGLINWNSLTGKPNFNNSVTSNSTTEFATPSSVKAAYDRGSTALAEANKKEPKFNKNTAFNKSFGTTAGTVLEGDKINQTIGKNYGGILNLSGIKTAGLVYFDRNTKKLFLCKRNNHDTSANVNNYIALDNNSILERLCKMVLIYSGRADFLSRNDINIEINTNAKYIIISESWTGYFPSTSVTSIKKIPMSTFMSGEHNISGEVGYKYQNGSIKTSIKSNGNDNYCIIYLEF